jgi:glycerophosphoryl diester phosphodiesterase
MAAAPAFLIIAHRGDSAHAPENTLAAFDLALAGGALHFETDAQLSADGVPVVLHDEALGRTNNGAGPTAAATVAQLQALDAGGWFSPACAGARIPTLGQVLSAYKGRAHIHLVSALHVMASTQLPRSAHSRTCADGVHHPPPRRSSSLGRSSCPLRWRSW